MTRISSKHRSGESSSFSMVFYFEFSGIPNLKKHKFVITLLSPRSFTPSRDSYAAKMQPSHDASHDHHQHPTKKQRTLLDYFSLQQNTGPASQTQSTEQETLMHNTPAESNEQAPTEEQPDLILENTVLSAELPTLIIQPNTTVNSFARSRHRAQQLMCPPSTHFQVWCWQSSGLLTVG